MRSLLIKMILMTLALGVVQSTSAAEFADPSEYTYEVIDDVPSIMSLFGGGQTPPQYEEEMIELAPERPRRQAQRVRQAAPPPRVARAARVAPRTTAKRAPRSNARPAPRVRGGYCPAIRPQVESIVGQTHASCYLKLFHIESTCRYNLPQAAGNAGNPYAAYGLCSLERSPVIHRLQRRPSVCNDISTLGNQVRCCQAIMRKSPHYFGPVLHGKVPRCG